MFRNSVEETVKNTKAREILEDSEDTRRCKRPQGDHREMQETTGRCRDHRETQETTGRHRRPQGGTGDHREAQETTGRHRRPQGRRRETQGDAGRCREMQGTE